MQTQHSDSHTATRALAAPQPVSWWKAAWSASGSVTRMLHPQMGLCTPKRGSDVLPPPAPAAPALSPLVRWERGTAEGVGGFK